MSTQLRDKRKLMTKTAVKETYGLPESWIKRLGEPDKVVPNPHRKSQRCFLFSPVRVETFIDAHRDEYVKLMKRREKRQVTASRAAKKRIDALLTWAQSVEIQVADLPRRLVKLCEMCQDQGNNFILDRGKSDLYTLSSSAVFAFVRHNWTNYESLLYKIKGKPGCQDAYLIIYNRCFDLVENALVVAYGDKWYDKLG